MQSRTDKLQGTIEPINVVMDALEIPAIERLVVAQVGLTEEDTVTGGKWEQTFPHTDTANGNVHVQQFYKKLGFRKEGYTRSYVQVRAVR